MVRINKKIRIRMEYNITIRKYHIIIIKWNFRCVFWKFGIVYKNQFDISSNKIGDNEILWIEF